MTPKNEQYEALMAVAELVEIDALDPDDELPYYVAQALNMNTADVQEDPELVGLMARLRTTGSQKEVIVRKMLDYVYLD